MRPRMQGASAPARWVLSAPGERGPTIGSAAAGYQLYADYTRIYGGYLSKVGYGDARHLPYAVEQP